MPRVKKSAPPTAPAPAPAAPVPKAAVAPAAQRPGWTAPSVVAAPKKPKKRSSVPVIPGLVRPEEVDAAYAAKQALDNAEAEYRALTSQIKEKVVGFAQGQTTTVNLPGSHEIAAQVSVKRDSLVLKDPEVAKQIAGPYFYKWFREEITGVHYVVPQMIAPLLKQVLALPEAQRVLQAAGVDPSAAIVEQKIASYTVADDWQRDQAILSALLGGDSGKVDALKACVEVDRRSGTSLRWVGLGED